MEIDRTTILIISLVIIVVWMVGKRYLGRKKKPTSAVTGPDLLTRVETWYGKAKEHVDLMEEEERKEREAQWQAKPEAERLELINQFLKQQFSESVPGLYRDEEKLQIGTVWYVGGYGPDT